MTTRDSVGIRDANTAIRQVSGTPSKPPVANATESVGKQVLPISESASPKTFANSTPPSTSSTRHYDQPTSVKGLTHMILKIATKVANGDASPEELDEYRLFAALTRTAAQLIGTDTQRSRFLGEAPNLEFGDEDG